MPIRHDTTAPRSALWDNDHVGNLDDLDDVNAPSPSDNDSLTWDAGSSTWVPEAVSAGGVTDHGDLTGLSDDDHTGYLLADGTRKADPSLTIFNDAVNIAPSLYFEYEDGAAGQPDPTEDIGRILFRAYNTGVVGQSDVAVIRAYMGANPSGSDSPGTLRFGVAKEGATTVTEMWVLDETGAFRPAADSLYDIGLDTVRAKKVYADEYAGVTDLNIDLSVSGAHAVAYSDGATHDLTLAGDATISLTGAITGAATDIRLILRQDGTGGWTVTWPGSVVWADGSAPVLQTAANAVDTIGLLSVDDGTSWFGYHVDVGAAIAGIEVAEQDGAPDVADVTRIEFVGATVTDDTGGQVTVTVASSSMTTAEIAALGFVGRIVMVDGITDPPEPVVTENLDDYVYEDLP